MAAQQRALEQAELLQEVTKQRDAALDSNDALKDVRAALAERDAQLAEVRRARTVGWRIGPACLLS